MTQYFISESTRRLEEGKELKWEWPEFPELTSVISNIRIELNRTISFVWDNDTTVSIAMDEQSDKSVVVKITEGEKELNEKN